MRPELLEHPGQPERQRKVPTEQQEHPVRPGLLVHPELQVRRQPSALPEYLQTSVR